jgi:hypothetical protein
MHPIRIVAVVAALLPPASSFAQEWTEYVDRTERFSVNFPAKPTVRETTYQPQRGAPLRARVFTVQDDSRRYSVTVVNLAGMVQPSDVKGSVSWEAWNFRKRGGDITYDAFAQVDGMDGHQLYITNLDKSLTVVGIYVHAKRLYILEAGVPPGTPGALHFQQSLMILDEGGKRIRYELDADGNRLFRINLEGRC